MSTIFEKKILIKVYDKEGNYLKSWKDATFEKFTKEINGGLGECIIKLARKFDNYGEYFDVNLNNEVRILITDRDTKGTTDKYKLIYSGYISKYDPWIEGGKEGVTVYCLGYYTKLAHDIYKNGSTTTITESGTDVGQMFRNLMDRYIAETSNPKLHYSNETIRTTGTTATYNFELATYYEAIEIIRALAPPHWWWYVNQYHEVIFKSKPASPSHTFIFGKHFHKIWVEKSMEKITNVVFFWNRNTEIGQQVFEEYTDATSITNYGRRAERIIDQDRIGGSSDAQKISENYIEEHKDPDVKVKVEILDNSEDPNFGYDIESIEPGQTCNFAGFNEKLDETFKENMFITKVEYRLNKVILTIET